MSKALFVAANLLVLAVYVVGSGWWVRAGDAWYRSLERPAWQPPDVVFGLAWPYNFAMLAVIGTLIAINQSTQQRAVWLGFFTASVIAALAWANLFYVQQNPAASAVALGLAALLTVPMVWVAFRYGWPAGVAMLPYIIWLSLATSLAVGYAALNPAQGS